ncbi:MAG: CBS domain-containing protein [Candidatus Woesearchaeota archaeon]|jgi:signal-transduction protein with cAMP-binding, CBS, and nucleotidyltransferase domain
MYDMKSGLRVFDAMTKKPVIVPKETSIADCARIMANENIGSLVIGSRKKLDGIVTEQDIVRKVFANNLNANKIPISEVMVKQIFTVSPEIELSDAIQLMSDFNIKHLPVIARKHVIGYVTLKDILRVQPQLCELVVDIFSIREAANKPVFLSEKGKDKTVCPTCGKITDITI